MYNKIIKIILCINLFTIMHGMQYAKLILQANPRISALGFVKATKDHIKFYGLVLAIKNRTVVAMIKKYRVLQKAVTQSLGYKSFTNYLKEYYLIRKLKQAVAKGLEDNGVNLDLVPTEGFLLSSDDNIKEWFNDYVLSSNQKQQLEKILNNALKLEKEKWREANRQYSLYHGTCVAAFAYKYLKTKQTDTSIPLLLKNSDSQKIATIEEFQKANVLQAFDFDDWKCAEYLLSVNLTVVGNVDIKGESSLIIFVNNRSCKYTNLVMSQKLKDLSDEDHLKLNDKSTGVLLQIFLDKETLDKTTYHSLSYGIKSKNGNVSNILEGLANFPMTTKSYQARIIATKDYLLNEDWAGNAKHFQVVVHIDDAMQKFIDTLAEKNVKALE